MVLVKRKAIVFIYIYILHGFWSQGGVRWSVVLHYNQLDSAPEWKTLLPSSIKRKLGSVPDSTHTRIRVTLVSAGRNDTKTTIYISSLCVRVRVRAMWHWLHSFSPKEFNQHHVFPFELGKPAALHKDVLEMFGVETNRWTWWTRLVSNFLGINQRLIFSV